MPEGDNHTKRPGWVGDIVMFSVGLLCLVSVPVLLAYRIYSWLRYAEWPVIDLAQHNTRHTPFSWAGVERIFQWYMHLPLELQLGFWGAVFVIGVYSELQHRR